MLISQAVSKLGGHDPSLVAAWGLGCGGVCRSKPDGDEPFINPAVVR